METMDIIETIIFCKNGYDDHHAPHEGAIIGFKLKEPGFKFAVVVKDDG
jgi:hypothetical protein